MSQYLTAEGEFTFPNKEKYEAAVALLLEGGWMDKEGYLLDETEARRSEEPDAVAATLTINFPFGLYRNIGAVMDALREDSTGQFVWTCTDGIFSGGVIRDGHEESFDLEKWAKERGLRAMPDPATDFDKYVEWQNEVEEAFLESFE